MTGREVLYRCRRELREVLILQEHRDYIMTTLLPRAIQYQKDSVQKSTEDYHTETLAKAADLDARINRKMQALLSRQEKALQIIDALPDANQKQVLITYYLQAHEFQRGGHTIMKLHTWESAAKKIGYSEIHAKRLHKAAMKKIER